MALDPTEAHDGAPDPEEPVDDTEHRKKLPTWDVMALTERPELIPLLAGSVATGLGVGWFMFPDEWSATYRIVGGLLLGFGAWFILYINRMIGGSDF